jgi:glycosyl transferase family 87
MTSDDHELIRRLRDAPPDPGPSPGPEFRPGSTYRADELGPATPIGSPTFIVHDDWGAPPAPPSERELGSGGSARRAHIVRLSWFTLAVVMALAGLGVAWQHLLSDPLGDARAYYDAATRLNLGHALYPAGADPNAAEFYRYPPLLAIALRPFALLPYQAFALLWELVVIGSFALLVRQLGARSERTWLAIGVLGIPIGWALSIAQAQVPMTLLVAIGQPWSIALAANLKLFPALVALWWIGRRDWQATIAFVAWMLLLALVQLLLDPQGATSILNVVTLADVGGVRNVSPYLLSPAAWAILLGAGVLATLLVARTRWGWAAAVTLATLASPRLLVYMLMSLIATVREPKPVETEESGTSRAVAADHRW